jgi:uncharacterized protein YodC (DUF2158 family)
MSAHSTNVLAASNVAITAGDSVCLRCGGHQMLVRFIYDINIEPHGVAECVWFDSHRKEQHGRFLLASLRKL